MQPTKTWICDTCGQPIRRADQGWVEWLPEGRAAIPKSRRIRIVHDDSHSPRSSKCGFGPSASPGFFAITQFRGPDGLVQLLEMIAEEYVPTEELLEVIKRILIPGYEHARIHFKRALAARVITQDVASGFWWQRDIKKVLKFAAKNPDR